MEAFDEVLNVAATCQDPECGRSTPSRAGRSETALPRPVDAPVPPLTAAAPSHGVGGSRGRPGRLWTPRGASTAAGLYAAEVASSAEEIVRPGNTVN